jgi:hypothetical protein
MARKVTAPDGTRWRVGRQWAPWRVKIRPERPDWTQRGDGGGGDWFAIDDAGAVLVALGILVVLALVFLVAWPLVALALEIVLVGLGVLVTAAGRVVLRRPWTVRAEVRGRSDHHHVWTVTGWKASGALVDAAAGALATGGELPEGKITFGTAPEPLPVPRVGAGAR